MSKVNWGVLGTAGIAYGQTIPGMLQAYNCNLYAIAGRSLEKANQFKEKFGFDNFLINYIGPVIGSHTGPDTIALFFMGETK